MKTTITGEKRSMKFYPSNRLKEGETFKAHVLGFYCSKNFPTVNNLRLKSISEFPPTNKVNKAGEVSVVEAIKSNEDFILNVHGQLKWFKANCEQMGIDPIGKLLTIKRNGSYTNKAGQNVAIFLTQLDSEQVIDVPKELPSDEELDNSDNIPF